MLKSPYRRNIALLGASEVLSYFGITSFWLLFLSQKGMSLFEIGILESLFHGTCLISEVPSGMLADRFSYKITLYLSRLSSIVSALLMLFGHGNFWLYALGMVVNAWSYNFDSGTGSAMLYESCKEAGLKDKYLKISSFIIGLGEGTRTLGMVAAGLFVHGLLDVTYVIQIILSLFAIVMVLLMKEPSLKLEREKNLSFHDITKAVVACFRSHPQLLWWLMLCQSLSVVMAMFYFYFQNEMTQLTSWQISLVMLASSGVNLLAVFLAGRLGEKTKVVKLFMALVLLTGLSYGLVIFESLWLNVAIFLVTDGLFAFFNPIFNSDLQLQLPSEIRATMLSVAAMFFSLFMIVIFPVTGYMIDRLGFVSAFVILGGLLVLSAFVFVYLHAHSTNAV